MGTLFVDKLDPQSGTSLELGSSGDTVSVNTGATTSLLGNVTLGASGKTITVPSGCTITNSGTASGFGENNTPHWEVGLSADQSISNTTWTKLQFSVDRKNASGSPDYWDNSNYRTQNLTAGDYFAYMNLTFEGSAGSSTAYLSIKRYNCIQAQLHSLNKIINTLCIVEGC